MVAAGDEIDGNESARVLDIGQVGLQREVGECG